MNENNEPNSDGLSIDVHKNESDKVNKIDNVNNEELMENDKHTIIVSPNGRYLVTYDPDNHLIVGWNVENVENVEDKEEQRLTRDSIAEVSAKEHGKDGIERICVSDNKILAYKYVYARKINNEAIFNLSKNFLINLITV